MVNGIIGLVIGLAIGFFASRYLFKRNLKKNPPINEKMIRAMFMETQIKRIMKNINDQYK